MSKAARFKFSSAFEFSGPSSPLSRAAICQSRLRWLRELEGLQRPDHNSRCHHQHTPVPGRSTGTLCQQTLQDSQAPEVRTVIGPSILRPRCWAGPDSVRPRLRVEGVSMRQRWKDQAQRKSLRMLEDSVPTSEATRISVSVRVST